MTQRFGPDPIFALLNTTLKQTKADKLKWQTHQNPDTDRPHGPIAETGSYLIGMSQNYETNANVTLTLADKNQTPSR